MESFKWKLPKSRIVSRLNLLSLLTIIGTIIYVIVVYQGLPDEIPIHFNLLGEADGWGGKGVILVIPFGLLPPMALVYAFSKMPHYLHAGELSQLDKMRYISMGKHLSALNFIIALLMFYIPWMITQTAHERNNLGPWALYIILAATIIVAIRMGIYAPRKWQKDSMKGDKS